MRWLWMIGALSALTLTLVGCATLLPNIDPDARAPAPPALLGPFGDDPAVSTPDEWRARRAPKLRQALAAHIYGPSPPPAATRILARTSIEYAPLAALANIEQWTIALGDSEAAPRFNMVLVAPKAQTAPAPVIVMQNFCGNRAAFEGRPQSVAAPLTKVFSGCERPWLDPAVEYVFGRYINAPPYEDILAHGYGVALFYAGDVVADDAATASQGLQQLYGDQSAKAGAIAAWASLYSRAIDVLSADPRVDASRLALWGHSRNGKAALLAGALDERASLIIAHQSGRGGASLTHNGTGESIAELIKTYPYWFPPTFAEAGATDPALDQHQLLALIAPRPLLLGNSRRDAWADPNSAFAAAQAADAAYELLGAQGLSQSTMDTPVLDADIAFYLRPGTHGVTREDWRVFLAFLDAHFKRSGAISPSASRGR